MSIPVLLSIRGKQSYLDQEPEVIELVTEGTLEQQPDGHGNGKMQHVQPYVTCKKHR